jgi:pimeloyl-ACP methyl ester carboxylesterase
MNTLALDWGRMHLRERPGSGPLLLFLHGTGLAGCWDATWERLPADAHLLACDYRAHGESDVPEQDFTFTDLAADIRALVASRGSPPCILVGHSLGGMLAASIVGDLPSCRGLVLVEGWISLAAAAAFADGRYYAGAPEALRLQLDAQSRESRARVSPARWEAFWRTVTAVDNHDALAAWPGPVIHQYGAAGRHVGTEAALRLPATPASRLEWVDGIGHFAPWLRPDTIARACQELLAEAT